MNALGSLGPGQRSILLYGLPVVGVAAIVGLRKKSSAPTGTVNPTVMASQSVLGTSQLAEFEQQVADTVGQIQTSIATLAAPAPAAAPAPMVSSPSDAPVPVAAPAPFDPWTASGNSPATNPNVSPSPPVVLMPGATLPPATGVGQRYIEVDPSGAQYPVVYG